jgi:hypothetical protein
MVQRKHTDPSWCMGLILGTVCKSRISANVALQNNANEAQGNWEAALQSKDRAIQQLEDALSSKERALAAMAQRERIWRASESKTVAEQQEHEQRMHLLRAQVADANATMAALKEQIRGRPAMQPLSPIAEGTVMPESTSIDHSGMAAARLQPRPLDPLKEGAALPDSRSLRAAPSLELLPPLATPIPLPAAIATPPADSAELLATSSQLPKENGHSGLSRSQMAAAKQFDKPISQPHSHALSQAGASTNLSTFANTRRPLSPLQASAVNGTPQTFHVEQHTHVHSPPQAGALAPKPPEQPPWLYVAEKSPGRARVEDSENAREIARTLDCTRRLLVDFSKHPYESSECVGGSGGGCSGSSWAIEKRLDALVEEQQKLMAQFAGGPGLHAQLGNHERDGPSLLDRHLAAVTAKADFLAERVCLLSVNPSIPPFNKYRSFSQFYVVSLLHGQGPPRLRAMIMQSRRISMHTGLQVQTLEQQKEDLQASLQERDTATSEQRQRADALQARVSDLERARPAALEEQQALRERIAEDVERLERRLLARDTAAKKYKDGCRALKSRTEDLERVRQKSSVFFVVPYGCILSRE